MSSQESAGPAGGGDVHEQDESPPHSHAGRPGLRRRGERADVSGCAPTEGGDTVNGEQRNRRAAVLLILAPAIVVG